MTEREVVVTYTHLSNYMLTHLYRCCKDDDEGSNVCKCVGKQMQSSGSNLGLKNILSSEWGHMVKKRMEPMSQCLQPTAVASCSQ